MQAIDRGGLGTTTLGQPAPTTLTQLTVERIKTQHEKKISRVPYSRIHRFKRQYTAIPASSVHAQWMPLFTNQK